MGVWLYAERIESFLATQSAQFMTVFKPNDWEDVCVFVDIFNLVDTRHTEGRVLEVTSWISSFRLCCIIAGSAVINSDVPTGMRRRVLRCSPLSANTHTFRRVIPLYVIFKNSGDSAPSRLCESVFIFAFNPPTPTLCCCFGWP